MRKFKDRKKQRILFRERRKLELDKNRRKKVLKRTKKDRTSTFNLLETVTNSDKIKLLELNV